MKKPFNEWMDGLMGRVGVWGGGLIRHTLDRFYEFYHDPKLLLNASLFYRKAHSYCKTLDDDLIHAVIMCYVLLQETRMCL